MHAARLLPLLCLGGALLSTTAFAGPQPKVDVCHPAGKSGNVLTLNVNANSLGGHLGHGDWLPETYFDDADGDGYGDGAGTESCVQPAGTSTLDGDCDDSDAATNPGATEVCDGIDNNCNGGVDEGFDQDNDGWTTCDGDCDDSDAGSNPGADEVCGDGIDNNCDGDVDEDCFSDIDLMISADNGYMVWIDGVRYFPEFQTNWQRADWISVQVPAGDHTVSVYVEDWGVVAYFAATLWVDGNLVSQTGDGNWLTDGAHIVAPTTWQARVGSWDTTGPMAVPGGGNWTDPSYDDSGWFSAPTCGSSLTMAGYAAIPNSWADDFDTFYADGTEFIWTRSNCRTPYNPWYTGHFRHNFTTP